MEFIIVSALNGVSYGLLLFMLSSGLTLIFGMMGVLNFAHASLYMLGAYFAYSLTLLTSFWLAILLAPIFVGVLGAVIERYCLRPVHRHGHAAELLVTFGISIVILEIVQLCWGVRSVDYRIPAVLNGSLFKIYGTSFPIYRGFMMAVSLTMLLAIWVVLKRTRIGLVIQASLTHPSTVEALGHNVPRVFMLVFGGGAALAGLAGAIGGNAFITEPGMAATVGSVIFVVVVVGGLGSLPGAFIASLLIGVIQSFAIGSDRSLAGLVSVLNIAITQQSFGYAIWKLKISEIAPILPYIFLVAILVFRPKGLLGVREA